MTDLRTLAQAVVSAYEMYYGERNASVGRDYAVIDDCRARYYDACKAVEAALGLQAQSVDHASARAILAALDAERAQGYALAMGEVVERCESTVRDYVDGRRWDTRIMGMCDEAENIAEWASEQAGD